MKKVDFFPDPMAGERKKVVIIGGGVSGALSAFELAHAGHEVTLIEAGNLGNGSSQRSAACIRQQFGTPSTVRGMIFSTEYFKNWREIIGGDTTPIVQSGYLFLKSWNTNMAELADVVMMQQNAGLKDVRILTVKEIEDQFGYIDTTGLKGATWCPSDGFLDPGMVYTDAANAARLLGATIIQNDQMVSATMSGNMVKAIQTKSGRTITAESLIVVNAAGAWAPEVSEMMKGYRLDIKARKRYLYFMDGLKEGRPNNIMTVEHFKKLPMIITPDGCYCRKDGQRLMMGWLHNANPIRPTLDSNIQDEIELGFAASAFEGYAAVVKKEMASRVPDISENMGAIYTATSGLYEDTPDHNPLIGYDPWVPNVIHAAGFSGHGLMHAPFTARIVSRLVSNGKNLEKISLPLGLGDVDVKPFHVNREFSHSEKMVI